MSKETIELLGNIEIIENTMEQPVNELCELTLALIGGGNSSVAF
jgi:hypothetical protein